LEAAPLPSKAVLRLTSASRALAAKARSGSDAAARVVDAWRRHLEPPASEFAKRGVVVRRGALDKDAVEALAAAADESLAAFEKEVLAPQNKTIRDSFDDASGTTRPGSRVDVRHRAAEFVAQRLGTCEAELADDDRGVGTRLLRDLLPLVKAALRTERPRLLYLGFVRAFAGGTVDQPWHRDAASLFESSRGACDAPDTPPHVLNIFFPLVDLRTENGPTAFAPGTHSDGACRDALATIIETGDPAQQISPLLSTGDAVMFDCRLLHRGRANRSTNDRVIAYLTVAAPWWRDDEMFHSTQPTTAAALLGEALLARTAVDDNDDGTGHPHYTLRIESMVVDRPDLAAPAVLFLARASDEVEGKWAAAAASSKSLSRMLTASLDDPRPADAFADRFEADLLDTKGRRADALRAPTAPNGGLFSSITDDLADCSRLYAAAGALLNAEAYGFPADDEGVPLLLALAKRAAPQKSRRRLEAAFTSWWHRGRGRFELVERVAGASTGRPVLVVAFSSLGSGIARPV
jgi:ectoine hydroxylase-related dioxygenase (phytanoyl-CoA dioxygenase family)